MNIALNKPAATSGFQDHLYPWATPDKAVDGDDNNNFHNQHCSQNTELDDGRQWWQVDLELKYWITSVQIAHRGDGN